MRGPDRGAEEQVGSSPSMVAWEEEWRSRRSASPLSLYVPTARRSSRFFLCFESALICADSTSICVSIRFGFRFRFDLCPDSSSFFLSLDVSLDVRGARARSPRGARAAAPPRAPSSGQELQHDAGSTLVDEWGIGRRGKQLRAPALLRRRWYAAGSRGEQGSAAADGRGGSGSRRRRAARVQRHC